MRISRGKGERDKKHHSGWNQQGLHSKAYGVGGSGRREPTTGSQLLDRGPKPDAELRPHRETPAGLPPVFPARAGLGLDRRGERFELGEWVGSHRQPPRIPDFKMHIV